MSETSTITSPSWPAMYAVAVVGDHQPVARILTDGQRPRHLRVGEVDRGHRAVGDARRVERVPVGREAGLVAEEADRQARLQRGLAAVLVEVVDVDPAGGE